MGKLNADFNRAIGKFEAAMKKKLLIKSIFYKRVFGGKGFEFDSFRNYASGEDDSALIDWKASMKGDTLLVRQYIEERDLNIFFLIDIGDNMIFGSGEKLKIETSAELSAALSHLILSSGDKVGFALYNEKIAAMKPFYPGMKQFFNFIKNISNTSILGGKSDLKKALSEVRPFLRKSSAVFIISDFLRIDDECAKILKNFMLTHETIGIMIRDKVENKLSDLNTEIVIEDIDTGEQAVINPELIKDEYERNSKQQKQAISELFKKSGADLISLESNEDFTVPLVEFLRKRIKKRKFIRSK
jgi:uncharacterized protein (DUF58 family)